MQCAYCTSGMILSAVSLLANQQNLSDAEILQFMQGKICRCGTYPRILAAVRKAGAAMGSRSHDPKIRGDWHSSAIFAHATTARSPWISTFLSKAKWSEFWYTVILVFPAADRCLRELVCKLVTSGGSAVTPPSRTSRFLKLPFRQGGATSSLSVSCRDHLRLKLSYFSFGKTIAL